MRASIAVLLSSLVLISLMGCDNGKGNSAAELLAPAGLEIEPTIQQYADPDTDISTRSTFTVLPYSAATGTTATPQFGNDLLEKQMLYQLRNMIEQCGYKYVDTTADADLVFTLSGSNDYKTVDVPASSITVPQYVAGRTITTNTNTYGNANVYGTYGSAYGTYSGYGTATTRLPGYWTTQTYTRPGYTTGNYYPVIALSAFDSKSGKNIWYASGVGCSRNPDVRVSSQGLYLGMLKKLTGSQASAKNFPMGTGRIGIDLSQFTPDGTTTYLVAAAVVKGSPCDKAGIKQYDVILSIDGKSMTNRTYSDVLKAVTGDTGSQCVMDVARGKKVFTATMTRIAR